MQWRPILLVAAILSSTPAAAYVWIGNPMITLEVDRPEGDLTGADVELGTIRLHHCGGGWTDHDVDAAVDLVPSWSTSVAGGDYCGVSLHWNTTLEIDATGGWSATYAETATSVTLTGPSTEWVHLTPYTASGGGTASPPRLYVTLD